MSKVDEAIAILKALGLPKAQQNERSALTLLALLDLKIFEQDSAPMPNWYMLVIPPESYCMWRKIY